MRSYPVHYTVVPPPRFTRIQLLIRVVAFVILAICGLSFGAVFAVAYVALPVYAAARLSTNRSTYLDDDGPYVIRALRWFAALAAWAGLVAEHVPGRSPDDTVHVEFARAPQPNAGSALLRIVTGLPSAIVLALACWIGMFVWLWAALSILVTERVGSHAFGYLTGVQRWSIRLLAYQASLVDEYPPFSFADDLPIALPPAHAV